MPSDVVSSPQLNQRIISVRALRQQGVPLTETTYLTIGGGLGSFVWVDLLLIAGVSPHQILALGLEVKPYGRFERLCHNSQIPALERLRSNSDACPDNIWGWPSYGLREFFSDLWSGRYRDAFRVAYQLLGEPILTHTYTPRAGDVFRSLDREAARIGWSDVWRAGRAKAIRKTDDGRYVVAYTPAMLGAPQLAYIIASYVHVALGYPRFRVLDEFHKYREQTQDFDFVVNAYEPHEQMYERLLRDGGTVIVSGRGIVASRIIQRLSEVRAQNPQIHVLHLMRSPVLRRTRYQFAWRKVRNHCEVQPFNWPKACFGGTLCQLLQKAGDQRRSTLLHDWGGSTTADRKDWQRIVSQGLREGWYQNVFGEAKWVERLQNGELAVYLHRGASQREEMLSADFLIICTGLEGGLENHRLLKDMVTLYRLDTREGHLKVTGDFEVLAMRNGNGRCYAAGVMTAGTYAPVDSFLGLQYAALRSVDNLALLERDVRPLTALRSLVQWTRWVLGVHP